MLNAKCKMQGAKKCRACHMGFVLLVFCVCQEQTKLQINEITHKEINPWLRQNSNSNSK